MSQRMWIAIAGVIGIGVAILLIPRPDTGDDITVAPVDVPTEGTALAPGPDDDGLSPRRRRKKTPVSEGDADRMATAAPRDPNQMIRPGASNLPNREGIVLKDGPNPSAAAAAERRNTPEALAAGRVSAPWTQIARELMNKSGGGAEELAAETSEMIGTLREMRRNPQDFDFVEIEGKMDDLQKRIRDSGNSNDEIERMFELIDTRMTEYQDAKALGADAQAPEGDG